MARDYVTVAVDLIEHADAVGDHLEAHGYRVKPEHTEIGFPYTPTLHCKRGNTTIIVEVDARIRMDLLLQWARYARSCDRDTRIALVLANDAHRAPEDEAKLRELGVGLYISDGQAAAEAIAARDLAVNVELPDITQLDSRMQRLLGPVYEKFSRSEWREGFEEACQVLEVQARRYLREGMRSGRLRLVTVTGRPSKVTIDRIDRMTIGALGNTFALIQTPNYADGVIQTVLSQINKDRVGVVHHKQRAATERRLRRNVGHHMWAVIAALKELLKIK